MTPFSVDPEAGITSELIDLETMPLSELRTLNHAALDRSLRHVVEQTANLRVTEAGSGE